MPHERNTKYVLGGSRACQGGSAGARAYRPMPADAALHRRQGPDQIHSQRHLDQRSARDCINRQTTGIARPSEACAAVQPLVERYGQFKDSAAIPSDVDLAIEFLYHGCHDGEAYSTGAAWTDRHRKARALVAQGELYRIASIAPAVDAKTARAGVGVLAGVDSESVTICAIRCAAWNEIFAGSPAKEISTPVLRPILGQDTPLDTSRGRYQWRQHGCREAGAGRRLPQRAPPPHRALTLRQMHREVPSLVALGKRRSGEGYWRRGDLSRPSRDGQRRGNAAPMAQGFFAGKLECRWPRCALLKI